MLRIWHRFLAGTSTALLALLAGTSLAFAHAELVASEPADGQSIERAPERVQLIFNEPIEPEFFAVEVYDAERQRVDRRDARPVLDNAAALQTGLTDPGPGSYTVVWRALSIDGHVVRGAFAFSIGSGASISAPRVLELEPSGAPAALAAAVRWLTFQAALLLVGGLAFPLLVFWPALRAAGQNEPAATSQSERRFLWLAWPAVLLLLALGLLSVLIQASDAAGIPLSEVFQGRAVTRLLTGTKYGLLWCIRMGLLLGLLTTVTVLTAQHRPGHVARVVGLVLGAAFLLTLSAGGHASAVQNGTVLAIGADWLHLLAASIWVGGLVQLVLTLPVVLSTLDLDGRRLLLGPVVRRFSVVALVSVAVLVISGTYTSLLHVPSWQALLDTLYGAALSGKLIVLAPLLLFGAVNLLVLHPSFVRAAQEQSALSRPKREPRPALRRRRAFGWLVLGEVVLASVVLAITGILTGLPPATTAPSLGQPFSQTESGADATIALDITPNQAGSNRLVVAVLDQAGQSANDVERVTLSMRHNDMEMGTREAVATPSSDGRYLAEGNYLSMIGRWQVEVQVQRSGGAVERSHFTPLVGQAPGANRVAFSPGRILLLTVTDPSRERTVPINPRFAAGLILSLAGSFLLVHWLRGVRPWRVAPAGGAILILAGLTFTGAEAAGAYQRSLPNPVPADAASLARGQEVYQTAGCASCHGDSGRGDGLAGRVLRPRPADFRVHMAAGHTDQELFNWISNGVDGTAMPASRDQLSEQQRWDVINYIRGFANPAGTGLEPPAPPAPPSPSPAPATSSVPQAGPGSSAEWVAVARWEDHREQVTEPFTVRSPSVSAGG